MDVAGRPSSDVTEALSLSGQLNGLGGSHPFLWNLYCCGLWDMFDFEIRLDDELLT